ncbi:hypothetical protein [Flavobacterium sp.]|uniref:hypothetical protein n=1 Tax=Flavobacterium sp. TaxID=239 RepID=UPI002617DF5D|nr:hypothetical protein [Flavobacterium sp.]
MEDTSLKSTHKSSISEFNEEEIRGWTIDRLYQVETKIDLIISSYFNPEKKYEFENIVLNSSIISIGGKLKILRNIKAFDKKIIDKIQKISSIRNAFAHLPTRDCIEISVTKDEKGNFTNSNISKITSQMVLMNSSGELKTKTTNDLIDEFYNLNKEISDYLNNYR